MRVCIVADSASVRFGGEAILPYHYFRLLRQRGVEAWLVVHDRTRRELESLLPTEIDRIVFSRDTKLHQWLYRLSTFLPRRVAEASIGLLSHLLTQSLQKRLVRRLVREQHITVIHQPTPVSPKFPSLFYGLDAPVVIGPLNGGMDYPPAFRRQESSLIRLSVLIGRYCSEAVNVMLPGKRRAAFLLVANERTSTALPKGLKGRVVDLVENAVDLQTWQAPPDPSQIAHSEKETSPHFVYIGRLVDWKRVDIAIRAILLVPDARLTIVGEGSMRASWESVALEAKDRIRFTGWQPHGECARILAASTALLLPSVYECGGAVVLEAMAASRPVIATGWGGPADYLDKNCGFLVEPNSEGGMIRAFANAMRQLAADPELGRVMGKAGRQRVIERFTWPGKMDQIEGIYKLASEGSPTNKAELREKLSAL